MHSKSRNIDVFAKRGRQSRKGRFSRADVVAGVGEGRDGIPAGMLNMNRRNPKVPTAKIRKLTPSIRVWTALPSSPPIELRNRLRSETSPVVMNQIKGERVNMELVRNVSREEGEGRPFAN